MIVTVAFRLWCLSVCYCFPLVVSQRGLLLSACGVSAWVVAFRLWCLSVGCCFPLVVSQLGLLLSACGVSAWVVAFLVVSQRGLLLSACGVSAWVVAFRLWCLSVACCFPLVVSQRGLLLSACGVSAWVVAFRLWCLSVACCFPLVVSQRGLFKIPCYTCFYVRGSRFTNTSLLLSLSFPPMKSVPLARRYMSMHAIIVRAVYCFPGPPPRWLSGFLFLVLEGCLLDSKLDVCTDI